MYVLDIPSQCLLQFSRKVFLNLNRIFIYINLDKERKKVTFQSYFLMFLHQRNFQRIKWTQILVVLLETTLRQKKLIIDYKQIPCVFEFASFFLTWYMMIFWPNIHFQRIHSALMDWHKGSIPKKENKSCGRRALFTRSTITVIL